VRQQGRPQWSRRTSAPRTPPSHQPLPCPAPARVPRSPARARTSTRKAAVQRTAVRRRQWSSSSIASGTDPSRRIEQRVRVPVDEHPGRIDPPPQSAEVIEARIESAEVCGGQGVDLAPVRSPAVSQADAIENPEVFEELLF